MLILDRHDPVEPASPATKKTWHHLLTLPFEEAEKSFQVCAKEFPLNISQLISVLQSYPGSGYHLQNFARVFSQYKPYADNWGEFTSAQKSWLWEPHRIPLVTKMVEAAIKNTPHFHVQSIIDFLLHEIKPIDLLWKGPRHGRPRDIVFKSAEELAGQHSAIMDLYVLVHQYSSHLAPHWPTLFPVAPWTKHTEAWLRLICSRNLNAFPELSSFPNANSRQEFLNNGLALAAEINRPASVEWFLNNGADPAFGNGVALRWLTHHQQFHTLSVSLEILAERILSKTSKIIPPEWLWSPPLTKKNKFLKPWSRKENKDMIVDTIVWHHDIDIPLGKRFDLVNQWLAEGVAQKNKSMVKHAMVLGADPSSSKVEWDEVTPLLGSAVNESKELPEQHISALHANLKRREQRMLKTPTPVTKDAFKPNSLP